MNINSFQGLPTHPLFVHVPVVGIPLVALMVLAYLAVPRWRASLFFPTGIAVVVVTLATIITAATGGSLQDALNAQGRNTALVRHHAELGDQTRTIMILFGAVALAYLALDWWRARAAMEIGPVTAPRTRSSGLTTAVLTLGIMAVLLGGVATIWDVRTGHAGAKAAWNNVLQAPPSSNASPDALTMIVLEG